MCMQPTFLIVTFSTYNVHTTCTRTTHYVGAPPHACTWHVHASVLPDSACPYVHTRALGYPWFLKHNTKILGNPQNIYYIFF